jgi:hypothetical protein
MKNREVSRQINRLNSVIQRAAEACGDNIEMQSHWSKYICVLSAGLLENSIKEIYIEYASRNVSRPIANFVSSQITGIRNPKTTRFLELAGAFKDIWRTELEAFVSEDGRDEAIEAIMNNRHLIAHGKDQDSRISLAQMKDYLKKSIEVLEYIENQCYK